MSPFIKQARFRLSLKCTQAEFSKIKTSLRSSESEFLPAWVFSGEKFNSVLAITCFCLYLIQTKTSLRSSDSVFLFVSDTNKLTEPRDQLPALINLWLLPNFRPTKLRLSFGFSILSAACLYLIQTNQFNLVNGNGDVKVIRQLGRKRGLLGGSKDGTVVFPPPRRSSFYTTITI